ncbi:hypothetical protein LJC17_03530 [Acholeplasma sp. OttesenSCG-928-E16]|nr:hypothetical protein [Acholeplasma sp. OttesenSCG-928-E16]
MLTKLFIESFLTKRKMIILLSSILVITIFIIFQSNIFVPKSIQYIEIEYLKQSYHELFNFIEIFTILITTFLIYDHDEKFHLVLIALKGRTACFFAKYIALFLITSSFLLTVFLIYYAVPALFSVYYSFDYSVILGLLSSYLGHLIFLNLILITTNNQKKNLAFLILFLMILYKMLVADLKNLVFFYLLPVNKDVSLGLTYGIIYQVVFILGTLNISYLLSKNRQLK